MKIFLTLFFITSLHAETKLILIGGGKRPPESMEQFVQLAGGARSTILVIPWASGSLEGAQNIKTELQQSHPGKVEILALEILPGEFKEVLQKVENASGIFFTGGNQNLLMKAIKRYQLLSLFKTKFAEGTVFGGTSAGTAIMSDPMLTGESDLTVIDGSKVELASGLGLLPKGVIIDQHFILRQRFNRLAGVILSQPNLQGIGLDEGMAITILDRQIMNVHGPSQAIVFSSSKKKNLSLKMLTQGDTFSFK